MRTSHQSEILRPLYFIHLTVTLIETGVTRRETLMTLKVTLSLWQFKVKLLLCIHA